MAPFYAAAPDASVWYNPSAFWTQDVRTVATVKFFAHPPRLRLPPPAPTVRRAARPPRPRPHAVARTEAVRRGRAEARPSRALRQRRRRLSRATR